MTTYSIRLVLPYHLQTLRKLGKQNVTVEVSDSATYDCVIEAIELAYPMLRGRFEIMSPKNVGHC